MKYSLFDCQDIYLQDHNDADFVCELGFGNEFTQWLDANFEKHTESDTGFEYYIRKGE